MITLKSGRKIGPGQVPYIIAEVGSNWRTFDDAKASVVQAKKAGADAVKFQAFTLKALFGLQGVEISPTKTAEEFPEIKESDGPYALPLEWLPLLKQVADAQGIDFLCSAFSPELVDKVNPFVEMHKVASAELSHVRLLERIRDTGKPVLLSTGASTPGDIRNALHTLEGSGPVVLLYCVAAYPATDIDLRHIDALARQFNLPVGYSDHSTDSLVIPKAAISAGACVLEKHFTAIEADTPDRPHSLTAAQFKRMVLNIRGELPFVWGSGEENEMRTKHNRRLIVTRDIPTGAALEEGANFGVYRSLRVDTRGLPGFVLAQVHGRTATRDLAAGEAIGPGDFA